MSASAGALGPHHPAPQAARLPTVTALFMVFGGPVAWFLQLAAGTILTVWPCFPGQHRLRLPLQFYDWTGPAAVVIGLSAALVALASAAVAWRKLREVQGEKPGDQAQLLEKGEGRTRFLATWGVIFGAGSALVVLATMLAFLVVPRCAA